LSIARDVYDCFGVDVSDEAVEVLRQRLGVPARAGDVRSLDLPEASFDVVTMFDVIEHVREPGEVLAAVGRFLAPHGVVMLTTGDVDSLICRLSGRWWHLMTPPEHLSFFSGRGIVRLAERCGLEVRRLSHEPVSANLAYIAHKLADVAGGPTRWLPAAVSVLHLDAVDVDVNLLDVMTVVARRR
jgi:SAM-dependent methyltransferase